MTTAVMSDYLEGKFIDYILRQGSFPAPASVYLALFTTSPADAGGGVEVSGGSYVRKQLTGAFGTPSNGSVANSAIISFITATANWGDVAAVGIFDAVSGGNLLFYGSFGAPLTVNTLDTLSIGAGNLVITLGTNVSYFLANEMLDHILNGASFTQPTNAYLALYTTMPDAGDSGGVEVSGGSYARQQCFGSAEWAAPGATDGHTQNVNTETYPTATADWGTVIGMAIRSAVTAGSLYFFKTLTINRTVYTNDIFRFSAGEVDLTLS
jgi:hypothetical protein